MTQPIGPPSPPRPEETWNDLRRTVTVRIPESLRHTRRGILKLRRVGRLR